MKKLRVLFYSRRFFPTISGMSVYALNLLRELCKHGIEVTLVAQYRGDAQGRAVYGGGPPIAVPGVTVIGAESIGEVVGGDFERDIETLVRIGAREHARRPFDLVHAQYGYPPGLAALETSRKLGIPNVVSIQGGDGHWVGSCCAHHRSAMRAVLDHAGAVLIGSPSFAAEVQEHNGTAPDRFTFIPGAVDTERFRPEAPFRPGELRDAARPELLFHGRVDARKGALDLIDAFARLLGMTALAPRLTVSGIGPDSEAVAARVRERDIERHVRLTGYVPYDDVPRVYQAADVFVSPTYAEGFSNTILEAMASGLPVLSTRAVGVVDCIRHEDNGLLVEPRDVEGLAAAMLRLVEDASLRARLATAAHEEVTRVYSWHEVGRRIIDVYRSLPAPYDDWSVVKPDPTCRFRSTPHLL